MIPRRRGPESRAARCRHRVRPARAGDRHRAGRDALLPGLRGLDYLGRGAVDRNELQPRRRRHRPPVRVDLALGPGRARAFTDDRQARMPPHDPVVRRRDSRLQHRDRALDQFCRVHRISDRALRGPRRRRWRGKNASEARTVPSSAWFRPRALLAPSFTESTRLIWPAPTPTRIPARA